MKNINVRNLITFAAAALVFAGCASTDDGVEHLEEGQPGVETMPYSWGLGGIGVPAKFTVQPGDTVERSSRTCELGDGMSARLCRAPLDAACNDDGGIPLPDTLMRPTIEDGEVVAITVTVKCRFPAND
jgi:hypothetical protein